MYLSICKSNVKANLISFSFKPDNVSESIIGNIGFSVDK